MGRAWPAHPGENRCICQGPATRTGRRPHRADAPSGTGPNGTRPFLSPGGLEERLDHSSRRDRQRPAGVERQVGDDLGDLRQSQTFGIVQGVVEVVQHAEALAAGDQRGQHHQVTVLARQARALPQLVDNAGLGVMRQGRCDAGNLLRAELARANVRMLSALKSKPGANTRLLCAS